jgi:hypothetical protein
MTVQNKHGRNIEINRKIKYSLFQIALNQRFVKYMESNENCFIQEVLVSLLAACRRITHSIICIFNIYF